MLPKFFRAAIALTSTALIVPYAVAFITELLYGKSAKSHNRYLRALHPYRVYALNLALLSTLTKLKYAKLYLKWTKHYKSLSLDRVVKDISFGQNQNSLDIYKPLSLRGTLDDYRLKPIVVFIYGGNWGSGDKSMYSLLCSQIADNFNCLVVCPNYSTYPKGFVDDMVQDVSDALQWVMSNAVLYGGDKSKIALIGHSAGGHLAALTILELYLKCLNTSPGSLEIVHPVSREGLPFRANFLHESTFVREVGGRKAIAEPGHREETAVSGAEGVEIVPEPADSEENPSGIKNDQEPSGEDTGNESFVLINPNENNKEEFGTPKKEEKAEVSGEVEVVERVSKVDRDACLLRSIKFVIGMAGVYDIKEHYHHEASRAIEHYSTMSRAMYDDENNFDNFSPLRILKNIPANVKLPTFHLMHGSVDATVRPGSSISFAETLWQRGSGDASTSIFVDCNHIDICLDLMDEERRWYGAVMNELKKAFQDFSK